jgi:uncharacterized membrane protein
MKKLVACAIMSLIALSGCQDKSVPGGPGATGSNRDSNLTTADNTFRLDAPNLGTDIKQGETKTIKLGINRGKNFDQDVRLDFGTPPQGVKITPESNTFKASEKEVTLTVAAEKDAALGEHVITVTGTPAREGKTGTTTFKINVKKPD